jgi:carbon-monoxide dehydrogenase medium subunit
METMNDFVYHCPASLAEAVRLLASEPSLRPLAGGTDMLPQMEDGSRCPVGLVDVKAIPDLNVIAFGESGGLRIGAAVPLARVRQFAPVRERYPMLAEACALIGSEQIRARATIGGNLCNAAPSADTAPPLLCLDAEVVIAGPENERKLVLSDFFVGPGQTALRPDEILVAIELPPPPVRSYGAYLRHTPRAEMDIAVVGVATLIALADDEHTCRQARIALGAVAPTPIRASEAERILTGLELTDSAIAQAAEAAREAARPIDDVRGSAWFRLELVGVLTERALRLARAQSEPNAVRRGT